MQLQLNINLFIFSPIADPGCNKLRNNILFQNIVLQVWWVSTVSPLAPAADN